MFILFAANWLCLFLLQEGPKFEAPDDLTIWNGLSLTLAFNVIITVLRALRIVPDGPLKKSIGFILTTIGMIIGGVYAYSTGVDSLVPFFSSIVSGGAAGIGAVGLHSSVKNFGQAMALLKTKKQ